MLDLETVRRECGVEKAVLAAYGGFGHVAVQYALANPERVSALALICTSGSFAAWPVRSMLTMIRENWDLYIDVSNAGFGDDDSRRVLNDFCKACAGPVEYLQMVEAFADSDISATLGAVSVPTIVLHSMDQHWLDPEEGRRFAAAIPGAEMVLVDGQTEPNQVATVRAIEQFLDANGLLRSPPPQLDAAAALTERQAEVLQLVARGKTNREVSQLLFLSERTVERHLSDIYAKLGARNRAEAISFALRHG
jgi:DNA-binding CsgD family transcriptional regulator/pimeloyl-ACP methyl ester carboxylesterase